MVQALMIDARGPDPLTNGALVLSYPLMQWQGCSHHVAQHLCLLDDVRLVAFSGLNHKWVLMM